ncbi:MAG: acyltransferase [Candidimonas sp.]|nr:MAG: acyltransferase [Candidimonas sp.]TAM25295.1 MAG: acyltransferase [Candidimonas sp.]TAM75822.1 MAG: acyltransferase [Candidimonas sp.]
MNFSKLSLLRGIFSYFGHCNTRTRLRYGRMLGWLTPKLLRSRARIVRINLARCFPDRPPSEQEAWLQRHFYLLAQSVVDRGLFWFGPSATIKNTVNISGLEHLEQLLAAKRRIIMLAPHFIALDAAATRLSQFLRQSATLYTPQSDNDVDYLVREGRSRFNDVRLVSRHDGVRGLIRQLRAGIPIYYLPDMDFGRKGAMFVPFFGIQAATIPATAQIAKTWGAVVVPVVSQLDPETGRYNVQVLPPLDDFPGEQTLEQATVRINQLIEHWVRPDPAQYYWVHRRFKTRPEGEKRFY